MLISEPTVDTGIASYGHIPSKTIIKQGPLRQQPRESFYGNREYKRHLLLDKDPKHQFQKRCTQLLFRIHEGQGRATYLIGVEDNGSTATGLSTSELSSSMANLHAILTAAAIQLNKLILYNWLDNETMQNRYIIVARLSKELSTDQLIP